MGILCLGNLARFLPAEENVEKVIAGWKMSTADANKLRFLFTNKDKPLKCEAMQKMLVLGTPRDWVLELMEVQNRDVQRDYLRTWKIPVFPVTGQDLIDLGVEPGPGMGKELAKLKTAWVNSKYNLRKADLLKKVVV